MKLGRMRPLYLTILFWVAVAIITSCTTHKPLPTMHWPTDPTAGVRVYKEGSSKRADALLKWSLHYAQKMGLPQPFVIFQDLPEDYCGMALPASNPTQVLVSYELSQRCSTLMLARTLALHELCHHRYAHVASDMLSNKEEHQEVSRCMKHYW